MWLFFELAGLLGLIVLGFSKTLLTVIIVLTILRAIAFGLAYANQGRVNYTEVLKGAKVSAYAMVYSLIAPFGAAHLPFEFKLSLLMWMAPAVLLVALQWVLSAKLLEAFVKGKREEGEGNKEEVKSKESP